VFAFAKCRKEVVELFGAKFVDRTWVRVIRTAAAVRGKAANLWLEHASRIVAVLAFPRMFERGRKSDEPESETPKSPSLWTVEYLVGSHESVVGRKVDNYPRIPRPIQDRCDSTVERAADETAGIQVPLVLELLKDRGEQIFWDPFADLHRHSLSLLHSPDGRGSPLPGGPYCW